MSSIYRILCLNHNPAIFATEQDWHSGDEAADAASRGVEGHEDCDLVVGRYSYPMVEVCCPGGCGGTHSIGKWHDSGWLRLLLAVNVEASGELTREAARRAGFRCWSHERLWPLRRELGFTKQELP